MVERLGQRIVGRLVDAVADFPPDADAAPGDIAGGGLVDALHKDLLCAGSLREDPGEVRLKILKAARSSEAASIGKRQATAACIRRATTKLLLSAPSEPWRHPSS